MHRDRDHQELKVPQQFPQLPVSPVDLQKQDPVNIALSIVLKASSCHYKCEAHIIKDVPNKYKLLIKGSEIIERGCQDSDYRRPLGSRTSHSEAQRRDIVPP